MHWKSFAMGAIGGAIATIVLILALVWIYNDIRRDDAIITCKTAIARVEGTNYLSHMGEIEIRACIEAGIDIPPNITDR